MTITAPRARAGSGLYALKPWYARRLRPVLDVLDRLGVHPDALSAAGIAAGLAGGLVLALVPAGAVAGALVLLAAALRLGCANLDGSLARRRPANRFGAVTNELGDRLADLALLAGLARHVGGVGAGLLLLASCLPSWVALAVHSAGGERRNGGPMGKTERAAGCVLAALTGWWVPIALMIGIGSVLTAVLRHRAAARALGGGRS